MENNNNSRYLFRGKRKDGQGWVEGSLIQRKVALPGVMVAVGCELTNNYTLTAFISPITNLSPLPFEVIPETVGEWIRKNDIGGKYIFEGDIVRWGHVAGGEETPVRVAVVELNPDIQFKQTGKYPHNRVFRYGNFIYKDTENWLEIIGNIHDNPDLLEK